METASRLCPDPEVLAAFLDQGLGADESVRVEAHLAGCDRCRVIVARVLDTQSAVQEAGDAAPMPGDSAASTDRPRFSRAQVVWGAGSLLAAAAVLAVMFNVGARPKLADLAAAVGEERPIEARLTGGFRYGPLRSPVRSGGSSAASDDWTLYAAAGRIRDDADRDPSAPNLHALGIAHLVLGQYDEAVRALEDAIAEDAEQPRYHSDLSAAYLARAKQLERPDDLPRALGAAERAIKGSETLLEARFNRALALEALFLHEQARQAWEDYVARDGGSGWGSDARARLQKLQQSAAPQERARNNSPPPITDTSVEAGLDWLLRQGLPLWADAVLANDSDRIAHEYSRLSSYAQQLTAANGDPIAASLLELADPSGTTNSAAAVIRGFTRGLALSRNDNIAEGEPVLSAACTKAERMLATLCDLEIGRFDVLLRRDGRTERRLRRDVTASASAYVLGRIELLDGYRFMFHGDYSAAIEPYERGFNRLRAAKYLVLAENVAGQLGEIFELIGLPNEAWTWRYRALQLSAQTRDVRQTYWTRQSIGESLARNENFHAARVLMAETDPADNSEVVGPRGALLDISRGRISVALGDLAVARAAFERAERRIASARGVRAERMTSDLLFLKADIERQEGQVDLARHTLKQILQALGPERMPHRVFALLTRANISRQRADWRADAERDVTSAIELLRARTAAVGQAIRLQDVLPALDATASLVSAQESLQGLRGLYLIEQLNELLNGVPSSQAIFLEEDLQRMFNTLEPGVATVVYSFSDDSLLTWIVSAGEVQFRERPVTSRKVANLANKLAIQVSRAPDREALLRQTLSELYDLILGGLPIVDHARELVVIPAGPINRVPIGALFDRRTNAYLFQRTAVRVAPSLALALTPSDRTDLASAAKSALIVGDPALAGARSATFPSLPNARTEAVEVATLYPARTVVVGADASKARVLASIGNAEVFHFAGHAVASSGGQSPRLLLAGDPSDPKASITSSDLATRLPKGVRVVLAACETGATMIDRAGGLTSISSAFLRAGAASVVATLWEVDDQSSATLFPAVHRGLVAGHKPAVAVALAQRSCHADLLCRRSAATWIGTTAYGFQ